MNMTYRIVFVCRGNACRSPFAECVMEKLLADAGIENIEVSSVGTLDWGKNPRDATMVDVAKELGYELTGVTTAMTRQRLMAADLIIIFDELHREAVMKVLDYGNWDRIVLFNRIALDTDDNVQDPFYQSADVYRRVAKQIENGCRKLTEKWKINPPAPEY